MKTTYCSHCETILQDSYCQHCGQKYINKRLTFWNIISDYIFQILSLEKSGFATVLKLITSPKKVVTNYWNGYRNYYQSPGKILFYFLTIAGLHIVLVNTKLFDMTIDISYTSPQFGIIFIIPLITISTYFTYFKQKLNFGEHFIATTYLFSVFGMLFIIIDDLVNYYLKLNFDYFNIQYLIIVILLWSVFVYSKNNKWYRLILNFVLNLVVFLLIVSTLIGIIYLAGGLNIQD